jgi:hypothetical protein
LLKDDFSLTDGMSSELSFENNPFRRLSPRKLPNPGRFSVVGVCAALEVPRLKAPNAPMGEKLAFCEADGQGEVEPGKPTGFVELRFKEPKGEEVSAVSRP